MIAGLFAGLLALLATGIPVGIGIGIVGIVAGYVGMGEASLAALPSTLFAGINSFLLIAIPLFILMSEILSRGGVTEILFNTVTRWLGHLPGGLAVSAVVTSAIGASITGSSVANAASMAIVCVPPLLARGYDRRFSYGLVAAAGTLGIMIPPSIPMLLYGEITEESIGALFMAGIIPGLLITAALIAYTVVVCSRGGVAEAIPKASWAERWEATTRAIPAMMLPIIVVGGIYSGTFTPTEAAAVGVTWALIVGVLIYRTVGVRQIVAALRSTLISTSLILVIIAGSNVLGAAVTRLQISQDMLAMVQALDLPSWAFIACTMVLLFILGMILEVISIIFIILPILHPIIVSLGVDPIWYAVIFTLNMEIALITPPVGMVLYVMTGILKRPITEIIQGVLPFVGVLIGCLIILMIFPGLSTWLPNLLR
ncbi:TRAP transporter large permease [Falsiroseomonas selenitidurans]|uniref:TRAP transporter large permease protein n=1 Tax=Falsiroseomonas selenitidurans TaxID=2716335 RepID=A0ABX1EBE2_9PROT|nr:TRAP transporter large permease [Falsiroseomonas selenitidurans]NKC34263.1 TRAP transporter large permease [Falsiroseomonas selenitidurans]